MPTTVPEGWLSPARWLVQRLRLWFILTARFLVRKIGAVGIWLALVVLFLVWAWAILHKSGHYGPWDTVYRTATLLTFSADWTVTQPDSPHVPAPPQFVEGSYAYWLFNILRLLIPVVALGGLILVLFQRAGNWAQLMLMPKFNHTVVCGLGEAGMAYIENWRDRKDFLRNGPVLVVDSDPENPNIERCRALGVPVVVADATQDGHRVLRRVNARWASQIVSMLPRDRQDIELAMQVQEYIEDPNWMTHLKNFVRTGLFRKAPGKPSVIVQVDNPRLSQRLLEYPRLRDISDVELRFESLSALIAEDLVLRYPPDMFADLFSAQAPHIAIHGFTEGANRDLSEQILLAMVRLCHFRNLEPIRITVFDRNPDEVRDHMKSRYRALTASDDEQSSDKHSRTRYKWGDKPFVHIDYRETTAVESRVQECIDEGFPVTQHVICLDDEEAALRYALKLRSGLIRKPQGNAPILVRAHHVSGIARLLDSCTGKSEIPDGLFPFGELEWLARPNVLNNASLWELARLFHELAYASLETIADFIKGKTEKDYEPEWPGLKDQFRRSNRNATLHGDFKLRAAGWKRVERVRQRSDSLPATSDGAPDLARTDVDLLETLSQMEHRRWSAEHFASGWEYSPRRSNSLRHRSQLRDWPELPEGERNKDNIQVRLLMPLINRERGMISSILLDHCHKSVGKPMPADVSPTRQFIEKQVDKVSPLPTQDRLARLYRVGIIPALDGSGGFSPTSIEENDIAERLQASLSEFQSELNSRLYAPTLMTTLVTGLERDVVRALHKALGSGVESQEGRSIGYSPSKRVETLVVLPLPYDMLLERKKIVEINSDQQTEKAKGELQTMVGQRNVRYMEMPMFIEPEDAGPSPECHEHVLRQRLYTYAWIARQCDLLIVLDSSSTSNNGDSSDHKLSGNKFYGIDGCCPDSLQQKPLWEQASEYWMNGAHAELGHRIRNFRGINQQLPGAKDQKTIVLDLSDGREKEPS